MNLMAKRIAVIGLGYVGLPLAALCAKKGYRVIGLETNASIVTRLQAGKCSIRDHAVEKLFADAVASSNLGSTTDPGELADCEIYLICVPTPVDSNNEPDLGPLESACRVIAPYLKANDLVVVESTVFPGTCEQVVAPLLDSLSELTVSKDFHLAHCPERVNPGDPLLEFGEYSTCCWCDFG